jgi:hypothetical protein
MQYSFITILGHTQVPIGFFDLLRKWAEYCFYHSSRSKIKKLITNAWHIIGYRPIVKVHEIFGKLQHVLFAYPLSMNITINTECDLKRGHF